MHFVLVLYSLIGMRNSVSSKKKKKCYLAAALNVDLPRSQKYGAPTVAVTVFIKHSKTKKKSFSEYLAQYKK